MSPTKISQFWAMFAAVGVALVCARAETDVPLDAQTIAQEFRQIYETEILGPHNSKVSDFDAKYLEVLKRELQKAASAGNLELGVALQNEAKRVEAGEGAGELDEETLPLLAKLRQAYHDHLKTLESDRAGKAHRLFVGYDAKLKAEQKRLTQESKFVEAQAVLELRDSLAKELPRAPERTNAASDFAGSRAGAEMENAIGMELCWIPAGTFTMGSPADEMGREPEKEIPVEVELTQGFWMGKYEVTQEDYEKVMGHNPSQFKDVGNRGPVETVSWNDAELFCQKLSEQERTAGRLPPDWHYTLPTEAQWEYACRAGTETALNSGRDLSEVEGECRNLNVLGWYRGNAGGSTHPVGRKRPNEWGLYDMHGNVREWCLDWYQEKREPGQKFVNPKGPSEGSERVDRGGYWNWPPRNCRSARRYGIGQRFRGSQVGFRVVIARE